MKATLLALESLVLLRPTVADTKANRSLIWLSVAGT